MTDCNFVMQYRNQSLSTMSKGELLVRLFEEALKNMRYASILLSEKNYSSSRVCTDKCKKIFNYLCVILDRNYEISADLYKIYSFLNEEIIRADIKRDASILNKIIPLVQEMRDTWAEANRLNNVQISRAQSR